MSAGFAIGHLAGGKAHFDLPLDAATARFCELGKSGYGKTNGDAVLIEGFVRGGVPTVVIDPLGQMYGLRSSADGEAEGIPIAVLGGEHRDLPLPFHRAEYVADMLAEGVSAVLDLTEIDSTEHEAFMRAFLPRLLLRAKSAGTVMHVNFQEADRFAPERGSKPTPVTRWARAARNAGMGWSFSTHKPQVLDKAIIETASCFITYKMTGELAQAAIGGEIGSRIGKKTAAAMIDAVASFRRGEAWLIPDPDWLDDGREWEPARVQFKLRDTFEIKPPKLGQEQREPKRLADIGNIDELRRALSGDDDDDTSDSGKTDTGKIFTGITFTEAAMLEERERADRFAEDLRSADEQLQLASSENTRLQGRIAEITDILKATVDRLTQLHDDAHEWYQAVLVTGDDVVAKVDEPPQRVVPPPRVAQPRPAPQQPRPTVAAAPSEIGSLGAGPTKILRALAGTRDGRATRTQLGFLSGYSAGGGSFGRYMSTLRSAGLVEGDGSAVVITDVGRGLVGKTARAITTADVHTMWRAKLKGGPLKMFDVLVAAWPKGITRDGLGEATAYEPAGGSFARYLSTLSGLEIIEKRGGVIVASSSLFPTGARR